MEVIGNTNERSMKLLYAMKRRIALRRQYLTFRETQEGKVKAFTGDQKREAIESLDKMWGGYVKSITSANEWTYFWLDKAYDQGYRPLIEYVMKEARRNIGPQSRNDIRYQGRSYQLRVKREFHRLLDQIQIF